MIKESIIRALLAGVFFIIFIWLGDTYLFDQEISIYRYLLQFTLFSALMAVVYYYSLKKQNKKDKE